MTVNRRITVFGAYGHTGKFVTSELLRRGFTPVLAGRDAAKLDALRDVFPDAEVHVADVENSGSIAVAISGSAAIINCAGPFLDTANPIIDAALDAGVHYLDVAAEQATVLGVFEQFEHDARTARVVVLPAMAFYGGLGDLLATEAMSGWSEADEISVAVALDSWKPTRGTRLTGERNHGPRYIYSNNRLERSDPPAGRRWSFPAPFGEQDVVSLPLSESIVIPRHLRTSEVRPFINVAPLTDLRDPKTPPPEAADASGRSAQLFLVDVIVRKGDEERRITASGRDIYAFTAPLVVEAVERILDGRVKKTGVISAGEAFDAQDFLGSLTAVGLTTEGVVVPSHLSAT